jgi:hypothetical protein
MNASFSLTAVRSPGLTAEVIDRRLGRVYSALLALADRAEQEQRAADGERVSEAQPPSAARCAVSPGHDTKEG